MSSSAVDFVEIRKEMEQLHLGTALNLVLKEEEEVVVAAVVPLLHRHVLCTHILEEVVAQDDRLMTQLLVNSLGNTEIDKRRK